MKTYREVIKKEIDDVICDCCGQSSTTMNIGPSWAELCATWGYGSIHDGDQYDIDICENCFLEILNFIKAKRKKVLGPLKYPYEQDPLKGKRYFP